MADFSSFNALKGIQIAANNTTSNNPNISRRALEGQQIASDRATSNNPNVSRRALSGIATAKSRLVDRRVRIQAKIGQEDYIYGPSSNKSNLMRLLTPGSGGTNGFVFPYTPIIQYNQQVDYDDFKLTHVNSDYFAYARTQTLKLTITGTWTVQNAWEARYALGCIHFLRTVTKMRFGQRDLLAGTPPPILDFTAHGDLMFNRVPVVISAFTINLPKNVDYVSADVDGPNDPAIDITFLNKKPRPTNSPNKAWLPSMFNIGVTLIVQQLPKRLRREFFWPDFRNGSLLKRGGFV